MIYPDGNSSFISKDELLLSGVIRGGLIVVVVVVDGIAVDVTGGCGRWCNTKSLNVVDELGVGVIRRGGRSTVDDVEGEQSRYSHKYSQLSAGEQFSTGSTYKDVNCEDIGGDNTAFSTCGILSIVLKSVYDYY